MFSPLHIEVQLTTHHQTLLHQKNPINYVNMRSSSPMIKPSNLWPVKMVKKLNINVYHQMFGDRLT
jgi:hypothetical protein